MRKGKAIISVTWFVLLFCVVGGTFLSFAASRKSISKVTIQLDLDLEPGEALPDLEAGRDSGFNVRAGNERYAATEAKWVSSSSKEAEIGKTYSLKVTLEAVDSDAYGFSGTYKSSNVTVKGGTFVSASRKGYESLVVTVKTKPVKGEYEAPDDAYWKDGQLGLAVWKKADGVSAYDVSLYRGKNEVYKVKGYNGTRIDFYPYMTSAGTYRFKVRSVPASDSAKDYAKNSEWLESDELYIAQESVSNGSGRVDYNNENSAGNQASGAVGWIQEQGRWWYRYPDGSFPKDSWIFVGDVWYLFDKDGWMLTGWQEKDGNRYFLDESGAMRTGWLQTGDGWYFLNPDPNGALGAAYRNQWLDYNNRRYRLDASGKMCEGWTEADGNWYYFYPGEGHMAVNTMISSFYVGEDGIWRK